MKIIAWFCKQIATLGPVGLLPAAGTCGTLAGVPLLFGFNQALDALGYISPTVALGIIFFACLVVIKQALTLFHEDDPSAIILDEVFGFFITMLYYPLTLPVIILGFIYFRLFDIIKPFGIAEAEELPGAWGIMIDDIIAGIYAHIALRITLKVLHVLHAF